MSEIPVSRASTVDEVQKLVAEVGGDDPWVVIGCLARVVVSTIGGKRKACLVVRSVADERLIVCPLGVEEFNEMVAVALAILKQAAAEKVGGAS